MSPFVKTRIATLIWGFSVVYYFTGELNLSSKIFLIQAVGNTFLMWYFIKEKYETRNRNKRRL